MIAAAIAAPTMPPASAPTETLFDEPVPDRECEVLFEVVLGETAGFVVDAGKVVSGIDAELG